MVAAQRDAAGVDVLYFLQADDVGVEFVKAFFERAHVTAARQRVAFVNIVSGDGEHK